MPKKEALCFLLSKKYTHLFFIKRGFTLIELLVSIAVMTIILGITTSGAPQAAMKLVLTDNVYKAELVIREAQLQGSAVSSFDGQYGGMGVFLDIATSSSVLKFHDKIDPLITAPIKIGDGLYDQSVIASEKDSVFFLAKNNRVGKLCVASGTPDFYCNDGATGLPIERDIKTLTVSFSRPKQTAHIYVNGDKAVDYKSACIQFDAPQSPQVGYVRSILVYRSGMITKKVGTCE